MAEDRSSCRSTTTSPDMSRRQSRMPDQPPSGANPEPAAPELEIRILPRQGAGDAYQVLARGSHAAEVTSEFRSPFTRRELDAALDALDAGSLGSVAIQRF